MKTIVIDKPIGYWNADGPWLRQQLADANGEDIRVEISSPGGFVFDGLEMFNLLKNYDGNVTTHIMGLAASMASYIALAGNRITAEANAVFMIHNVWGAVVGDYSDMEQAAETFRGLSSLLGKTYAARTGKSEKEIKALMDAESYFFGDEILEAGFVDEIIPTEKRETREDAVAYARLALEECIAKMKADKTRADDLKRAAAMLTQPKPAHHPASTSAGNNTTEVSDMTLDELRAQHPDLYNQAYAAGVEAERKRVMAHITIGKAITNQDMMFKNIETGADMSDQLVIAGYMAEKMKTQALNDRADDNPPTVAPTTKPEPEAYEKQLDAELEARFGLKPEVK